MKSGDMSHADVGRTILILDLLLQPVLTGLGLKAKILGTETLVIQALTLALALLNLTFKHHCIFISFMTT